MNQPLQRGLKNRHIQLIALGGAIGTGLFLGIGQSIELAGPSVLLGYAIAGLIAFLILRQLGEMAVEEPVAGSFSHFADKYCGQLGGFIAGWNYWAAFVLVSMAELSAAGIYMQYWWPWLPSWVSALAFFVLINGLSLARVKTFGEIEFWFAIIKVVAILGMIGFGACLLLTGGGGPQAHVQNLWQFGGFFPHGVKGLVMAMAVILFSFGGLELLGVTAAEAAEPSTSIPSATNQVLYRILIFYIGSIAILLALHPWPALATGGSPFVLVFQSLHSHVVADALNAVVLTAALSVYNSAVYSNTRMLYALALQGNAPRALMTLSRRGVPLKALGVSAVATVFCIALNYAMPGKAFGMLMGLAVSAMIINWTMISWVHLRFRAQRRTPGQFASPGSPWSNYLCLAFLAIVVVVMYRTPALRLSVYLIPLWLAALTGSYYAMRAAPGKAQQAR